MVNPGMTMPGMTMVNPWMTMATSGLVGNIGKQIGVQKVATNGTFNNIGSQIGVQVGRKKRAAQFNNLGSQIGQQIDQSQNFNFGPMPGMGQWGTVLEVALEGASLTIMDLKLANNLEERKDLLNYNHLFTTKVYNLFIILSKLIILNVIHINQI